MKKATIEKRRNFDHIFGKEFKESYEAEFEFSFIRDRVVDAVIEFEDFHSLNGLEMDEDDLEEVERLKEYGTGSYTLNVGDFTYYIDIE